MDVHVAIFRAGPYLPAAVALPILAKAVPGEQGALRSFLQPQRSIMDTSS